MRNILSTGCKRDIPGKDVSAHLGLLSKGSKWGVTTNAQEEVKW